MSKYKINDTKTWNKAKKQHKDLDFVCRNFLTGFLIGVSVVIVIYGGF